MTWQAIFGRPWVVACMMLNCTTRLQVDRVLWRLFLLVPTPQEVGPGPRTTERS